MSKNGILTPTAARDKVYINTTDTQNIKLVLPHGGKVERPSWKVGFKASVTPLHNTVQTSQAMEPVSVAAVKKKRKKKTNKDNLT